MPSSACQKCALRSEEHTSELQSHDNLVCRLLLDKKHASPPPLLPLHRTPRARASSARRPADQCCADVADTAVPQWTVLVGSSWEVVVFLKEERAQELSPFSAHNPLRI